MAQGILCKTELPGGQGSLTWWRAAAAALLYGALWACLCSMAGLGAVGLWALLPGAVAVLLAVLLPKRALLPGLGLLALCLLLLVGFRGSAALDGVRLFLNRLFLASEAQQAYTYQLFQVAPGEETGRLQWGLLTAGLATGLLLGSLSRFRLSLGLGAVVLAYAGFSAYLGVSPAAGWTALLAAASILNLALPGKTGQRPRLLPAGVLTLALAVLCGVIFLAFPGEHPTLSAWDDQARDALSLHTTAYVNQLQMEEITQERARQEEKEFFREEETSADLDGDAPELLRRWPLLLAILIAAVLLFVPAVLRDRLKKRRALQRAGLEDPDPAVRISACFLYSMRWLRAAGLPMTNQPYARYREAIAARFSPELGAEYEGILPLWQAAAYSEEPLSEQDSARMQTYLEHARSAAWGKLRPAQKLYVRWIAAL